MQKFRSAVERSRLLLPKQVSELFLNLDLIQEFHKSFLCELEERLSLWSACCSSVTPDDSLAMFLGKEIRKSI